jgi:hypothetical protein
MFIRDLLAALADAAVEYCLVGGVAVNLHGVPRLTYDVDIVVVPEREQLHRAARVLAGLGLSCRIPVKLEDFADATYRATMREEHNLMAVSYDDPSDPLREVDVLVSPDVDASDLVARATVLSLGDVPVRVASISDLIAMKRLSGRQQDAADVVHLERIGKASHG